MNQRETATAIDEEAARWVARIDAAPLDQTVQADLDRWLAGDDRRRGAFFRAQAAWGALDRLRVLAVEQREEANHGTSSVDAIASEHRVVPRRTLFAGVAAAAALVAAISVHQITQRVPAESADRSAEQIVTAVGEIRRLPLRDGSMVAINTASKLRIDLRPDVREVNLDRGEAWFQVAKDAERPFVVAAGDVRAKAVGTAFSVRRMGGGAEVQVTEGAVEVWTVGQEASAKRVAAGSRTFAGNAAITLAPVEMPVAIDRALSWRVGQLVFDGDRLASAAEEFNRYNTIKLTIAPSLADERIVGRFRTNEAKAFAEAASRMLGARIDESETAIRLSR